MAVSAPAKIFDCFTFFNELDLLEFRLELLSPTVDRFVIVEAPRTHSGLDKPLTFQENRTRFARYLDRISHVIVDDLPDPVPDRWVPERFQRDAIIRGLDEAERDDIIVICDLDEIPDPDVLDALRHTTFDSVEVQLRSCYYKGNWEGPDPWPLTKAVRRKNLSSPSEVRLQPETLQVADAGAHFSYLMSARRVVSKYSSFAHAELDSQRQRSEEHLSSMIRMGVFAPWGRPLTIVSAADLNPVQVRLLAGMPEHFDFNPPPRSIRRLCAAWSRFRSHSSIPDRLVHLGDKCLSSAIDLAPRKRTVVTQ
jgi:beta-1,4-mannosyl-glycoprotein beta-1,4-N-acetylglucosaminyltransferase